MKVSAKLRSAIKAQKTSLYRLAKDADVDWGTIDRFVRQTRPNIRLDTVDRLCQVLGLELREKEVKKRPKKQARR